MFASIYLLREPVWKRDQSFQTDGNGGCSDHIQLKHSTSDSIILEAKHG